MNNNFESHKFDRRSFLKASGIVGRLACWQALPEGSAPPPLPGSRRAALLLPGNGGEPITWSPGASSA